MRKIIAPLLGLLKYIAHRHFSRESFERARAIAGPLAKSSAYSHDYLSKIRATKCIFIHIPKSGGTSMKHAFLDAGMYFEGHHSYAAYRLGLGEEVYDQLFSFSTVRNPWDRLVSTFFFYKTVLKPPFSSRLLTEVHESLNKVESFSDFVMNWLNPYKVYFQGYFLPQSYYICKDQKIMLKYLSRFETLAEDMTTISERIEKKIVLPHKNKSQRSDYRDYYTEDAKKKVAKLYKDDIEIFRYRFDGFDPIPSESFYLGNS